MRVWHLIFSSAPACAIALVLVLAAVSSAAAQGPVVWVPDFFGDQVQVRAGEGPNTKAVTLLLNPDPANPTPCSPNSLAVNGGKLHVVCTNPDHIRVFDANAIKNAAAGAVLANQPEEKRITSNQFDGLIGIAFDGQNNLWVASFGDPADVNRPGAILEFSAASLGTPNPTVTNVLPNSPNNPVALAFDADGSLWVTGQFGGGIVLNLPADQLDQGANAQPRFCISNSECDPHPELFKSVEGLALFNGKIWVANNGGDQPGRELVALRVQDASLLVDTVFGSQQQGTGAVLCPGGLFATSQHLWVNDQGFNDPATTCGSTDPGSGVGAILRFTQQQLDTQTTDPTQIVRFSNITSRPGFGGIFVEDSSTPPGTSTALLAAVLPSSRSVQVGVPATAFATLINVGAATATGCSVAPITSLPATFTFQTTNPATNEVTGMPDTPVDIPGQGTQSFILALTPTGPIASTDVQLSFDCANTDPAPITPGLTTLLLSAATTPIPDIVALAATVTNDGIVNIPGASGTGVFSVATVNVGAGGTITVSADTGSASLPVSLVMCQTDPVTAVCLAPPGGSVTIEIGANATPTFGVFATGSGVVPFDPATNRIFVRFRDAGAVTRGATSVAVRTQ